MSDYSVPYELTNVAQVAVAAINADNTLSTGSSLAQSVWAGVGVFARGKPFEPLSVTKSNYLDVLGDPIKPSVGVSFEPIRHVYEAVQQTSGYVVRVVPEDAKYPFIAFGESNSAVAVTYGANVYATDLELASDQFLALYVDDGDPCDTTTRAVTFTKTTAKDGIARWKLKLTQTTAAGVTTTLETHTVSFDHAGVDDMGRPCFIETALESRSSYLRALCDADAALASAFADTTALAFTGGTNGSQNVISDTQYTKAVTALSNANVVYTAVLGLGCYSSVALQALADITSDRRIDGFIDVKPALTYAEALTATQDLELGEYVSVCVYHFPYTHKDHWTSGTVSVGLSGTAYAAKAKGVKKVSDVGGWHYSPAGYERGIINRSRVKLISGAGTPDYDAMYSYRVNKVTNASNGQMMIDDALTTYSQENYLRFQHVASTMNAIGRYIVELGNQLKHQPDGVTQQTMVKQLTAIFERFEASGALVTPRDTDADGTAPYILKVTQSEFDYWKVQYACCLTGTARRILAEPQLIK